MYTIENIRKNLIEAIKQSGMSQKEIADNLNIKSQSVRQYLTGRAMPALDTFAKLCALFDVESDYILGLIDIEGNKTYIK